MSEGSDRVLALLRDASTKALSGEALSRELGVSRAQIWKHVETLRRAGYEIPGEAGGGYRFEWYDSQGTEWERFGHILSAGFNVELPFDISFDGRGAYERYDYDNPSTFPDSEVVGFTYFLSDQDRADEAYLAEAELEKDITEFLSVSARYSYYDNSSNVRIYSYRRHIAGAYVNFRFD